MPFYVIRGGCSFLDTDGSTKTGGQTINLNAADAQRFADKLVGAPALSAPLPQAPIALLEEWALAEHFRLVSATRNSDGAITAATIEWPDGAAGTFTVDVLSTAFPGATDAWHATYVGASASLTITQPAVTRDANGAVIAQPALTIA